ncbi:MAG TPA: hypothetical protein VGH28_15105 [Polyangiaceae bacterium]|jgi:hypothetical protein
MNPFRQNSVDRDEEIFFKPRSRWPLRIAVAVMCGFVAFVYYGMFEAFGRDAVYTVPGPLGLLILSVTGILRRNDPRAIRARAAAIEEQAARRITTPDAPWPKQSPYL